MKRRLFIGIELPVSLKKKLKELIEIMSTDHPEVSWEQAEDIHLTLKFLGTTHVSPVQIGQFLEEKLRIYPAFTLRLGTAGLFMGEQTVVFIEVVKSEPLLRLYHTINNRLENLGFKREKRAYHPHVTLGRIKYLKPHFKLREYIFPSFKAFTASSVALFESRQRRYRVLERIALPMTNEV